MRAMKATRRSVAFLSGALLYSFGTAAAMQYAKIGLPRYVYTMLGGRNSLEVMLGEALAIALVLFAVATGWGYATLRPARRRHRPYIGWFMAGIGLAWAGWLIAGSFDFALQPRAYSAPLQTLLLSSAAAPLFGAFNIFGVLAGAALAGKLAKRRQLALPRTRSRRRSASAQAGQPADAGNTSQSPLAPHTVSPPL